MRVAALCDVHGNLPALEAVLMLNQRSGHFGTWEPRYRDLLADSDRRVWQVSK